VPRLPTRVLGRVQLPRLHYKSGQAAFVSRLSQLSTARTTIPEAKMYVGDDRSTQVEPMVSTSGFPSGQVAINNATLLQSTNLPMKLFSSWNFR